MTVIETVKKYKIVPVIVLHELGETAVKLGALMRGGLPIAEITFRTACAADAITLACKTYPDMLVGAGTVITRVQCKKAIECGAKFIVSPGLSPEAADECQKKGVPYFPGAVTPTEIMAALALGLTTIKFFPASDFGGLKTIKALSAAFPQAEFMPTGGIDENNIAEYLAFNKIIACGGSWMMKGGAEEIETKTKSAMKLIGSLQ